MLCQKGIILAYVVIGCVLRPAGGKVWEVYVLYVEAGVDAVPEQLEDAREAVRQVHAVEHGSKS